MEDNEPITLNFFIRPLPYKDQCRKIIRGEISNEARIKARKKHKKRK